ncbi:MAG TPA: aldo/keto reductase [Thermoanaerobaculia bacterium]|nr:aldo/keto reductase [Thermoanaerobaculia bacterium]
MTSSNGRTRTIQGVEVPTFLYGTAWKEEATAGLVERALAAGFRGIDTANQRRHYHEAGVGEALAAALRPDEDGAAPSGATLSAGAGRLQRGDVFLQSKYTYVEGQDHRLPYDPAADPPEQVRQSFSSSLEHLGVERLDSYLIHGPQGRRGLSEADHRVWRTFEQLHAEGHVRLLGISNVSAEQLAALCAFAEVPPAFVQNRCFARTGWDRDVRDVCRREGVAYQAFSLLTANRAELARPEVGEIAAKYGVTVPQVIFRLALQLDMIPLTGTTDQDHMREDLEVYGFELAEDEVEVLEGLGG